MSSSTSEAKRKPTADAPIVYWGEENCSRCDKKAYYRAAGSLRCGAHSRNLKRSALPKNPRAKEIEVERFGQWERQVLAAAADNRAADRPGTLTVCKLRMMRAPDHIEGVRNVFPNNKHDNRIDGFGCASLSPMRLGPVQHGQLNVPPSLTIENYHQSNKVFERDVERAPDGTLTLKPEFFALRDARYRDPVPHRHKYPNEKGVNGNKNIPLFSYHVTPGGEGRRYTYLQSRYFYCHQYELLAKQEVNYAILRRFVRQGFNLQIVGYDGYPVTATPWEHYNDTERPFGHELVLYCLLAIENADDYPWNRYYRENRALYE